MKQMSTHKKKIFRRIATTLLATVWIGASFACTKSVCLSDIIFVHDYDHGEWYDCIIPPGVDPEAYIAQLHAMRVRSYFSEAAQGDSYAQCKLGSYYAEGDGGVVQDMQQAVFWWRKAAEQGVWEAQNNLGACYAKGKGVTQDMQQAVFWLSKAAEQGPITPEYNLGVCYDLGKDGKRDVQQAVYWYRKVAEMEHGVCCMCPPEIKRLSQLASVRLSKLSSLPTDNKTGVGENDNVSSFSGDDERIKKKLGQRIVIKAKSEKSSEGRCERFL